MSVETHQVFVKDEMAPDGTGGAYQLSNTRIVAQTEEVVIETRDRTQSDAVLNRLIMVRYLDYKLDYYTGQISFSKPVEISNEDNNPNVIVVDYGASLELEHEKTQGARLQAQLLDKDIQTGSKFIPEDSLKILGDIKRSLGSLTLRKLKYLSVTLGILLSGVAVVGVASGLLFAPQSQSDFLHDHLETSSPVAILNWEASDLALPVGDKNKITQIVMRAEKPNLTPEKTASLVGAALRDARETSCDDTEEVCWFPIRLNRTFKAVHGNKDFRVVNVEETSLRVNVEGNAATDDVKYNGFTNETRLLRFYQTQTGWMQNTAHITNGGEPIIFHDRQSKFKNKFEQKHVGINYYPASASWKDFWTEFPRDEIESDLKKIVSLNANSVRIFLTHDYFDGAETREDALLKLNVFLKLCDDNNITVLVTLFDLRPNYELSNLQADINHIDRILPTLTAHKSVLGVDIKNQADLDFEHWGEGRVEGWLTVMARHIQMKHSNIALTVGWSHSENATRLKDVVDFITYHEYQNPDNFETRLNDIIAVVDEKPVMITELGSTVWTPFKRRSSAETKQAGRLASQLNNAESANGVFVWTLHDFEHVGREVVGPLPWRQAQQRHFGLIRADGSARPAVDIFKAYGERSRVKTPKSDLANLKTNKKENF